jgi:hypothetical protein
MLYYSIEMPGRAYIPAEHSTETLNEILLGCRYSEDYLANKHGDTFMFWGRASREGNQELCDKFEKECRTLKCKITKNINKMYKTRAELGRRDMEILRINRRAAAVNNLLDTAQEDLRTGAYRARLTQ